MQINKYIDHTLLKPQATEDNIDRLCHEAIEHNFCSVCVNPCHVSRVCNLLSDRGIKVCSVAGFPLGANNTNTKVSEAVLAARDGADEIDMVTNIGKIIEGNFDYIEKEIRAVRSELNDEIILKVIIETPIVPEDKWPDTVSALINAGADFVKTATGFQGATPTGHISKLAAIADNRIEIKASGGINTIGQAMDMIRAGATRLGCSASVAIMKEYLNAIEK